MIHTRLTTTAVRSAEKKEDTVTLLLPAACSTRDARVRAVGLRPQVALRWLTYTLKRVEEGTRRIFIPLFYDTASNADI